MDELRKLLNSMTPHDQRVFSARCGTTVGYLRKAISTRQQLRAELCVRVERESSLSVTRKDLHPNDWHEIWPELIDAEHPAPSASSECAA